MPNKKKIATKAQAPDPAKGREIVHPVDFRRNVRGLICEMISEQRLTDQEIVIAASKIFPKNTVSLTVVAATRSEMNYGARIPSNAEGRAKYSPPQIPYEKIVNIDGVNMLRSERPRNPRKPRKSRKPCKPAQRAKAPD